jgi:hypothetical protein
VSFLESKNISKEALKETYEKLGAWKWKIKFLKGRPLGFAIVEFKTLLAAKSGLEGLNSLKILNKLFS